jgi:FtsP/CotA-like multicopper oxidase with cupredoxin domain
VGDDEEDALKLPAGNFDLPLTIQDRTFDSRNQLVYSQNMMERMMGFMAECVLVNAAPDYIKQVERRAYRLRLFNGSNATAYRLSWNNGELFWVTGTDGGLLERTITRRTLTLGVGERADVWMDFAAAQPGDDVALVAESFAPMLSGGGGMLMMRRPANKGAAGYCALPDRQWRRCEGVAAGASFEIPRSRSARSRQWREL